VFADDVWFFHAMLATASVVEVKICAHLDERIKVLIKEFSREVILSLRKFSMVLKIVRQQVSYGTWSVM
jgi:hypothetical protein